MGILLQLPRRYDVRKSPRRLARKPKAPVLALVPRLAAKAPAEAYRLYLEGSAIDDYDLEAGARLYERALKLDPSLAICWTNLGNVRFKQGFPALAKGYYDRALELQPDQPEALYNLGYLTLDEHNPTAAILLFKKALEVDPHFADAWYNLAMAYEQLACYGQAKDAWRCYLKTSNPTTDKAWRDVAFRHLEIRAL